MDFSGKTFKPNHYDLLEVNMGADEDEIRRAYERVRQVYAEDSLATYGLYTPEEVREYRELIERAFRVLVDNEKRRAYDRTLIAKPVGKPHRILVKVRSEDPEEPEPDDTTDLSEASSHLIHDLREELDHPQEHPEAARGNLPLVLPAEAEITGALLRQLREEAGVDLRAIAEETKVSVGNLRMIEEETWAQVPAWVYVRGFIILYANYLGLDGDRLLRALKPRHAAQQTED